MFFQLRCSQCVETGKIVNKWILFEYVKKFGRKRRYRSRSTKVVQIRTWTKSDIFQIHLTFLFFFLFPTSWTRETLKYDVVLYILEKELLTSSFIHSSTTITNWTYLQIQIRIVRNCNCCFILFFFLLFFLSFLLQLSRTHSITHYICTYINDICD